MTQDSQDTNTCPGNCGASSGFGTCEESTGKCSCSMGWTGIDCNDATCCPLWIVIAIGSLVFIGVGSLIMWRVFRLCNLHKVFPSSEKPVRSSTSLRRMSEKAQRISRESSERLSQEYLSSNSVTSEYPDQDVSPGSPTQQGRTSEFSGCVESSHQLPKHSKSINEAILRSSAWGEAPPTGRSQAGVRTPKLRRAQTFAGGRASMRHWSEQPEDRPQQNGHDNIMGRSQSERPKIRPQQGECGPSMGRSQTSQAPSEGASKLSPHVPVLDDENMTHVKSVEKKMRDMMNRPLLVRKRTLKDLLVEHHPDKNSSEHAPEVFKAVNNARSWFLHDSESEPQNEAGEKSA